MEFKEEHELRTAQLSFIGKILSVFTHELNNHLAILKESAGLIDDILTAQKSSAGQEPACRTGGLEGCSKALQLIAEQIGKASYLSRHLNRFGHRMDKPLSSFNVNEILEELLSLLNRAANQKMISFEKDFHENIPVIQSDPSRLQFLIFCLIEKGLMKLDKNGKIIFRTGHSKNSISICITYKGNVMTTTDEKQIYREKTLQYLLSELGGSVSQSKEEETIITLPYAINFTNTI